MSRALESLYVRLYLATENRLAEEDLPLRQGEEFSIGARHVEMPEGATIDDLARYSQCFAADSDSFFSYSPPSDFKMSGSTLTFSSPLRSGNKGNDRVVGVYSASRQRERAFLLVPHWNARRGDYIHLARLFPWFGISCLLMSLPYHYERQDNAVGFAREMVSANLGRTLQANRQAVVDARACLDWLTAEGYVRIGVVGSSLGSSIATLVAAHDSRVQALCCLHMAEDFGEVVWTGRATRHIRGALETHLDLPTLSAVWAAISARSYVRRLAGRLSSCAIVSGQFDEVFLPSLTRAHVESLKASGCDVAWRNLPCGHYTLSSVPFNTIAFVSVLKHLLGRL